MGRRGDRSGRRRAARPRSAESSGEFAHTPAPMSPLQPDLVDCWIFRVTGAATPVVEILLIPRSPGRILPGLWQCVSGSLEPDERVAIAALREVAEETGYGPASIEAFYDLDLVNQFHE